MRWRLPTHSQREPRRENTLIFVNARECRHLIKPLVACLWLPLRSLSYSGVTVKKCLYFRTSSESLSGASVSARSKRMAQAIGLLCEFAIWCWCEDFSGRQHDIANLEKRPSLLFAITQKYPFKKSQSIAKELCK